MWQLRTVDYRALILPAWAPTHPSPDVLKRILATRVYPKPRDVFVTMLRPASAKATAAADQPPLKLRRSTEAFCEGGSICEGGHATRDTIGARATQVASDHGQWWSASSRAVSVTG